MNYKEQKHPAFYSLKITKMEFGYWKITVPTKVYNKVFYKIIYARNVDWGNLVGGSVKLNLKNRYFHYTVTKVSNGGFSVALTYSKINFVLPKVDYITKGNL